MRSELNSHKPSAPTARRIVLALPVPILIAAGLVGMSPSPSSAAGETCRGMAATLVGEPGSTLTGTPGDDVIVTNGAERVKAGEGDDTICVTPVARFFTDLVDAGPGADLVDTSAAGAGTIVLGSGADTFAGGTGNDLVFTDGDGDTIDGGRGSDVIRSGLDGQPNTDRVTITGGTVEVTGVPARGAAFDAGAKGSFVLSGLGGPGTWKLDADAEKLTYRGKTVAKVTGFSTYEIEAPDRLVRFAGTNGKDDLTLDSPAAVNLKGGRDRVAVHLGCTSARGDVPVVYGGPGRDVLEVDSCASGVRIDLERRYVKPTTSSKAKTQVRPVGFEMVEAYAQKVRLAGAAAPETMVAFGCDVEIRGDDGNDKLGYRGGNDESIQFDYSRDCSKKSTTARYIGGNGNDRLAGGVQDKTTMNGGAGRDKAFGGSSRDICQAEVRSNCRKP